jgi:hypothetical protein
MNFSKEQIKKIYEVSYSVAESKSKTRQNIINEVVIESLKSDADYSGCEFKKEVRIPESKLLWGKFFPIDVSVYRDNTLIELILIKAASSNISQNKVNYNNNLVGEIMRLSLLENIKLSIINFLPKVTPYFKRDETIQKLENNTSFFITNCGINYKFNISHTYIVFDIDNLITCKTKEDVKNLFITNPVKNIRIETKKYEIPS